MRQILQALLPIETFLEADSLSSAKSESIAPEGKIFRPPSFLTPVRIAIKHQWRLMRGLSKQIP
jgi:hypothetical protein